MLIPQNNIFFRAPCPPVPAPSIAASNMLTFGRSILSFERCATAGNVKSQQFKVFLWKWPYRVLVGEVELSWVFEDEVLTLFPFWILVLQVNSEAFNVFNPCRDATASSVSPRLLSSFLFLTSLFSLPFTNTSISLFTLYTTLLTRSSFIPTFFLLFFLPFLVPSSSSIFPLFSAALISIAKLSKCSTVLVALWFEVGFLGGHGRVAWTYLDINTGEIGLT